MTGEQHQVSGDNARQSDAFVVLVVNSEILVRLSICEHLREQNFEVVEAASASEAIELIQAGIKPGVVFTDFELSGSITGLDLLMWLKDSHIPGLMTAGSFIPSFAQVLSPGQFVAKPFTPVELAKRLEKFRAT